MISESQQEQTALYALGLLDAEEAAGFERQLGADGELRDFEHELRESIALLALAGESWTAKAPPPALRGKIMAEVTVERTPPGRVVDAGTGKTRAWTAWVPWALAALFMGCSGVLVSLVLGLEAHRAWRTLMYRYGTPAPGPAPRGMRVVPPARTWAELPP